MSRWLVLVLAVAAVVWQAPRAEAKCAYSRPSLDAWPEHELDPTGFILLTATASDYDRAPVRSALRQARHLDLRLRTDDERESVPLDVVFVSDGAVDSTQALLRPRFALRVGATYRLDIGNQQHRWQVVEPVNAAMPAWTALPGVARREYARLGCGPESHLWLSAPVTGDGDLRVHVRASVIATGATQEGVLAVHSGQIDVGRSMCGGAFHLAADETYRLEMWALDSHGYRVAMPSVPMVVRAPGASDAPPPWLSDLDGRTEGQRLAAAAGMGRSWWRGAWPYGLGLIALALTLGTTFLTARLLLRRVD